MCRVGGIFDWRTRFWRATESRRKWITTQTPRRWRKVCGEWEKDLATCFMRASERGSAPELFWMARFFMDAPDRRRKEGTSALIFMGRDAIAESADASRRWRRERQLRGGREKR